MQLIPVKLGVPAATVEATRTTSSDVVVPELEIPGADGLAPARHLAAAEQEVADFSMASGHRKSMRFADLGHHLQ